MATDGTDLRNLTQSPAAPRRQRGAELVARWHQLAYGTAVIPGPGRLGLGPRGPSPPRRRSSFGVALAVAGAAHRFARRTARVIHDRAPDRDRGGAVRGRRLGIPAGCGHRGTGGRWAGAGGPRRVEGPRGCGGAACHGESRHRPDDRRSGTLAWSITLLLGVALTSAVLGWALAEAVDRLLPRSAGPEPASARGSEQGSEMSPSEAPSVTMGR